jgi:hypothetical protein
MSGYRLDGSLRRIISRTGSQVEYLTRETTRMKKGVKTLLAKLEKIDKKGKSNDNKKSASS